MLPPHRNVPEPKSGFKACGIPCGWKRYDHCSKRLEASFVMLRLHSLDPTLPSLIVVDSQVGKSISTTNGLLYFWPLDPL